MEVACGWIGGYQGEGFKGEGSKKKINEKGAKDVGF